MELLPRLITIGDVCELSGLFDPRFIACRKKVSFLIPSSSARVPFAGLWTRSKWR